MLQQTKNTYEDINPDSAHIVGADFIDDGHIITYPNNKGPLFMFMRGCSENYKEMAPLYARELGHLGQLSFEYQLDGFHSQDQINQGVIAMCEGADSRDKVFVSTSMGYMNTVHALRDVRVKSAIGKGSLRGIISLSGIESRMNLQPAMHRAVGLSSHVIDTPVIRAFWQKYRLIKARENADLVGTEEALLHYVSSALLPTGLVASQHKAIAKSKPLSYGELRGVAQMNPDLELHQITAMHDAVSSWTSSRQSMSDGFGGLPVETDIDFGRHEGSHADDLHNVEPLRAKMAHFANATHYLMSNVVRIQASGLSHLSRVA